MNAADRILKKRLRIAAAKRTLAQREQLAGIDHERKTLQEQISKEVPTVLSLLAAHEYPNMVNVLVGTKGGTFRKERGITKAGWLIASREQSWNESYLTINTYLLADGRFMTNGYIGTGKPQKAKRLTENLAAVLAGLRKLQSDLG